MCIKRLSLFSEERCNPYQQQQPQTEFENHVPTFQAMADQGPGAGALDPHAYSFIPQSSSKAYHHQNGISDLTQSHITLLKNSPLPPSWLPPTSEADHPRLSDAFSEMRYLELNNCWDLNSYSEGLTARLVDTRSIDNPDTPINYRPWEKPDSSSQQQQQQQQQQQVPPPPSTPTTTAQSTNGHSAKHENGVSSTNSPENKSPPTLTPLTNAFPTFTDAFAPPPQKLPSFQSQFNAFTDNPQPPHTLESPHTLPSFHTLPANTRYPGPPPPHTAPPPHSSQLQHAMVPTGLPHRDSQPFLEDRHIQLFPGQVPLPHSTHHHQFPATLIATTQNGATHPQATYHVQMNGAGTYATPTTGVMTPATATIQLQELVPVPPMHTLLHPTAINVPRSLNSTDPIPGLNVQLLDTSHFAQQPTQNTLKYMHNSEPQQQPPPPQTHVIAVKLQPYETPKQQHNNAERVNGHVNGSSPPQQQVTPRSTTTTSTPKRQGKRKRHDQNGALNGHDAQNAHQVSSVSSTEPGYKRPNLGTNGIKHVNGHTNGHDPEMDKPVKKKRKRCGECIGCQRKDNCGECAPCRNDKSHQICKQRRCDKLTEKKTPKSKLKQQQQQQQQIQQPHHQ